MPTSMSYNKYHGLTKKCKFVLYRAYHVIGFIFEISSSMYLYIALVSIFLGFVPLSFYLLMKSKLNTTLKPIVPFLFLSFFASFYEFIFTFLLKIDVAAWFKIYTLIEFFVLVHYFYKVLEGRYKWIFYVFASLFLVCFAFIAVEGKLIIFMDGDSYLQVVESVFVITCVILWMKYAFINLAEDSLLKYPQFYFISGLLVYFSGTLFLFMLGNVILKNEREYFLDYWMVNLFFNIFFKIVLLIGIWKGRMK